MQYPNFFVLWLLLAIMICVLLLLNGAMLPLPQMTVHDGIHFGSRMFYY
ncbi:MAG: hypothetical protein J6K61_00140 [Clostridia bacterium]|nr:hypothetical protein [Clostridia bacterium]